MLFCPLDAIDLGTFLSDHASLFGLDAYALPGGTITKETTITLPFQGPAGLACDSEVTNGVSDLNSTDDWQQLY